MATENTSIWSIVANFNSAKKEANALERDLRRLNREQNEYNATASKSERASKVNAGALNEVLDRAKELADVMGKSTGATKKDIQASERLASARSKVISATLSQHRAESSLQQSRDRLVASNNLATRSSLAAERAEIALTNARNRLRAATNSNTASEYQIERAHLAVADAQLKLLAASQRVEASDHSRLRAQRAISDAQLRVVSSTERVSNATRVLERELAKAGSGGNRLSGVLNSLRNAFSGAGRDARGFFSVLKLLKFPAIALAVKVLLGAISSLAGGFVALAGAIGPAVGILASLPQVFAAAGQGIGTLLLGLSGVTTALKAFGKQQKAASKAGTGAAKTELSNAKRIRDAQQSLSKARQRQAEVAVDSAEAIQNAERDVARAQKDAIKAQLDLRDARQEAARDLVDMKNNLRDYALAEERASLTVEEARARLQQVLNDPGSTDLERRDAELAVREAQASLSDIKKQAEDSRKEFEAAQKRGVEGSQKVIDAREAVAEANERVIDSQRDLSRSIRDAARDQRDAAEAVREALEGINDAQDQNALSTGAAATAADEYAKALAKLTPEGRAFVKQLLSMQPLLDKLRATAEREMLPGFTSALRRSVSLFPIFNQGVAETGKVIGNLADQGARMVTSGPWKRDFQTILSANAGLIKTLGEAFFFALDAVRNITIAAIPLTQWLAGTIRDWAKYAASVTAAGRSSGRLTEFFDRTKAVLIQLGHIFGNIIVGIYNVARIGGRELGGDLLDSIETLTQKFKDFSDSADGENKIAKYFNDIREPIKQTTGLIGDIAKGFISLGDDPSLGPLIQQIREQLLPVLGQIFENLSGGDLGTALVSALTNLARVIADITADSGGFTVFVKVLGDFLGVLAKLIEVTPGASSALGLFLGVMGAFKGLNLIASITGIKGITGAIVGLGETAGAGGGLKGFIAGLKLLPGMLRGIFSSILRIVRVAMFTLGRLMLANPWALVIAGLVVAVILIIKYWDQIKSAVSTAFEFVKNLVSNVWDAIWSRIGGVVKIAMSVIVGTVTVYFLLLLGIFKLYIKLITAVWGLIYSYVVTPIWNAMKFIFENVLKPYFALIAFLFRSYIAAIKAIWGLIYDYIVKPILDATKWVINNILKPFFSAVALGFQEFIRRVKVIWDGIVDTLKGPVNTVVKWIKTAFDTAFTQVKGAFSAFITSLGIIWDGIKGVIGTPVSFVIDTVINKGIIDSVNKVLGFLKLPQWGHVPNPLAANYSNQPSAQGDRRKLAIGGMVPGTGNQDSVKATLMPGEFVLRKSAVKKIGKDNLRKINRGTQYFEGGGPVGKVAGGIKSGVGAVAEGVKNAGSAVGNTVSDIAGKAVDLGREGAAKGLEKLFGSVKGLLNNIPAAGGITDLLKGGANFIMKKAVEFVGGKEKESSALTGGNFTVGGNYGPPNFSGNAANTQAAINFIRGKWGLNDVGGWRAQGSVSTSDHPRGKAIDAMIPNWNAKPGISLGNDIANWFIQHSKDYGTKYIIWRKRINEGKGWAPYSHPSGSNPTLDHMNHVHLSLLNKGGGVYGHKSGVPAMLTPGEFVVNKRAAGKLGMSRLNALNNADRRKRKKYRNGGPVQFFHEGGAVQGFKQGARGNWVQALRAQEGTTLGSTVWDAPLTSRLKKRYPSVLPAVPGSSPTFRRFLNYLQNMNKAYTFSQVARNFKVNEMDAYRMYLAGAPRINKFPKSRNFVSGAKGFGKWYGLGVRGLEKLAGLPQDGIWDNNLTAATKHMLDHAFGRPHDKFASRPWSPLNAAELAEQEQLRANALNAEYMGYLETFASWGLMNLVNKLSELGPADGMEIARAASKDRKQATALDAAYGANIDISSEDNMNAVKLIGSFTTLPGTPGIRALATNLGLPDYGVVQLYRKYRPRIASRVPTSKLTKMDADLAKWDQGLFYANSGGKVPGTGSQDTVPALLTPGEFVINKKAVNALGLDVLKNINRYAEGGPVFAMNAPNTSASVTTALPNARGSKVADGAKEVNIENNYEVNIYNPTGETPAASLNSNLRRQARLGFFSQGNDS